MVSYDGAPDIQGPISLTPTGFVCADLLGLRAADASELTTLAEELGLISAKG